MADGIQHDHREKVPGCFRCDLRSGETVADGIDLDGIKALLRHAYTGNAALLFAEARKVVADVERLRADNEALRAAIENDKMYMYGVRDWDGKMLSLRVERDALQASIHEVEKVTESLEAAPANVPSRYVGYALAALLRAALAAPTKETDE